VQRSELLRRIKLGLHQVDALLDEVERANLAGRSEASKEAMRRCQATVGVLVSDAQKALEGGAELPPLLVTGFRLLTARLRHKIRN